MFSHSKVAEPRFPWVCRHRKTTKQVSTVIEQPKIAGTECQLSTARRDRGSSFVELLVAIVLLGSAVVAVLVSLQATTIASITDADHARALAWLQAASDQVFEAERIPCAQYDGTGDPAVWLNYTDRRGLPSDAPSANAMTATAWALYKNAVNGAQRPQGWASATIQVMKIEFLGKPNPDDAFFEWGTGYCFEGVQPDANLDGNDEDYRQSPLLSQKVTIQVTGPGGSLVKKIETVKSDR